MFDNTEISTKHRLFSQLLKILDSHMKIYWEDYEVHVVKALLVCPSSGHEVTISFDDMHCLHITANLPGTNLTNPACLRSFLRLQCTNNRLSHLSYDEETGQINVRSMACLPDYSAALDIVPLVVKDFRRLMSDDRLSFLIKRKKAS